MSPSCRYVKVPPDLRIPARRGAGHPLQLTSEGRHAEHFVVGAFCSDVQFEAFAYLRTCLAD